MISESFKELRREWRADLKRTNYFERPDSTPPFLSGERLEYSTISSLIVDISNRSGMSVRRLLGSSTQHNVCRWRQLGYYAAYRDLGKSTGQIGKVFGRDHSTVLAGVKRFEEIAAKEPEWLDHYQKIARELA